MTNKNTITGFIIGLIANIIGLYLASLFLGNGEGFTAVLHKASVQGFLGKLISIGALLNLVAFFIFISKRKDDKAKGVLIATIVVALLTLVIKFL